MVEQSCDLNESAGTFFDSIVLSENESRNGDVDIK
jgi:hypothetical protein